MPFRLSAVSFPRTWHSARTPPHMLLIVRQMVGHRLRVGQPSTACAYLPLLAVCCVWSSGSFVSLEHVRVRAILARGYPYSCCVSPPSLLLRTEGGQRSSVCARTCRDARFRMHRRRLQLCASVARRRALLQRASRTGLALRSLALWHPLAEGGTRKIMAMPTF